MVKLFGKRYEWNLTFLFMLFLFFLSAFRSLEVGNDTYNYFVIYTNNTHDGISGNFEPGYNLLSNTLRNLGVSFNMFLVLTSTISYIPVIIFIKRKSNYPLLAALVFYTTLFSFYSSGIRQSIAISLVLLALLSLDRKSNRLFFFFALIAFTFHLSSIIVFLVLLIRKLKFSIIASGVIVFITFCMVIFNVVPLILGLVFPSYLIYFESIYLGSGYLALTIELIRLLVFFLIFLMAEYLLERNSIEQTSDTMLWISVILICITILSFNMNLIRRINLYFILYIYVNGINSTSNFKSSSSMLLKFGILLFFLAYFTFSLLLRPEWNSLFPYNSFLGG